MNDYEKLFNDEIKEKKTIARGSKYRASRKKGFKGSMKTAIDFLKGKEKKIYMGNGDVKLSNLFDNIKWEDFMNADKDKRRNILLYMHKKFKGNVQKQADYLGTKKRLVCDHRYALGITRKHTTDKVEKIKKINEKTENKLMENNLIGEFSMSNIGKSLFCDDVKIEAKDLIKPVVYNVVDKEEVVISTYELDYTMTGELLVNRLLQISEIINKQSKYKITICLQELEDKQ
jgi:hypothetical protein